jgi:hypothetical protein
MSVIHKTDFDRPRLIRVGPLFRVITEAVLPPPFVGYEAERLAEIGDVLYPLVPPARLPGQGLHIAVGLFDASEILFPVDV